ncbi:hypothetical protein PsorP6_003195 [Peronosclerospora sorghi]|uniref:Uncharacterized protein n=1 Tax=Peronosclerospora sorghi TaxID=230839 RepID=A0ACC0VPC2_9STRA|nr:hypothetical protein PsorP6_003195 [Peronosclerospora sorghi]
MNETSKERALAQGQILSDVALKQQRWNKDSHADQTMIPKHAARRDQGAVERWQRSGAWWDALGIGWACARSVTGLRCNWYWMAGMMDTTGRCRRTLSSGAVTTVVRACDLAISPECIPTAAAVWLKRRRLPERVIAIVPTWRYIPGFGGESREHSASCMRNVASPAQVMHEGYHEAQEYFLSCVCISGFHDKLYLTVQRLDMKSGIQSTGALAPPRRRNACVIDWQRRQVYGAARIKALAKNASSDARKAPAATMTTKKAWQRERKRDTSVAKLLPPRSRWEKQCMRPLGPSRMTGQWSRQGLVLECSTRFVRLRSTVNTTRSRWMARPGRFRRSIAGHLLLTGPYVRDARTDQLMYTMSRSTDTSSRRERNEANVVDWSSASLLSWSISTGSRRCYASSSLWTVTADGLAHASRVDAAVGHRSSGLASDSEYEDHQVTAASASGFASWFF